MSLFSSELRTQSGGLHLPENVVRAASGGPKSGNSKGSKRNSGADYLGADGKMDRSVAESHSIKPKMFKLAVRSSFAKDGSRLPLPENTQPGTLAPHEKHVLPQITLKKQAGDGVWINRKVAMTKDFIHLSKEGVLETHILDSIPMKDIERIEYVEDIEAPNQDGDNGGPNHVFNAGVFHIHSHNHNEHKTAGSMALTEVFKIYTTDEGVCCGRIYVFQGQAQSREEIKKWVETAQRQSQSARYAHMRLHRLKKLQDQSKQLFHSRIVQLIITLFLLTNFAVNIAQAELVPTEGSSEDSAFEIFDIVMTIVFTFELFWNMFSHWAHEFWSDGWSIVDLIVVVVSWVSLISSSAGFSVFRVVRVFRAIRILGQLRELRRIIAALAASVYPVFNALVIAAVVNSMFAIAAVQFFGVQSPHTFGTFSRASYTLFLMTKFENPFKAENNMLIYDRETEELHIGYLSFFMLYTIIMVWTLLNVLVAVLLDNFVSATAKDKLRELELRMNSYKPAPQPLDPVLEEVIRRSNTESDLDARLKALFLRMDVDHTGSLNFTEIREGLRKLLDDPHAMQLSPDDWEHMLTSASHESNSDELNQEQFVEIMRHQINGHIQRNLTNSSLLCTDDNHSATLSAIKLLMIEQSHFLEGNPNATNHLMLRNMQDMLQTQNQTLHLLTQQIQDMSSTTGMMERRIHDLENGGFTPLQPAQKSQRRSAEVKSAAVPNGPTRRASVDRTASELLGKLPNGQTDPVRSSNSSLNPAGRRDFEVVVDVGFLGASSNGKPIIQEEEQVQLGGLEDVHISPRKSVQVPLIPASGTRVSLDGLRLEPTFTDSRAMGLNGQKSAIFFAGSQPSGLQGAGGSEGLKHSPPAASNLQGNKTTMTFEHQVAPLFRTPPPRPAGSAGQPGMDRGRVPNTRGFYPTPMPNAESREASPTRASQSPPSIQLAQKWNGDRSDSQAVAQPGSGAGPAGNSVKGSPAKLFLPEFSSLSPSQQEAVVDRVNSSGSRKQVSFTNKQQVQERRAFQPQTVNPTRSVNYSASPPSPNQALQTPDKSPQPSVIYHSSSESKWYDLV